MVFWTLLGVAFIILLLTLYSFRLIVIASQNESKSKKEEMILEKEKWEKEKELLMNIPEEIKVSSGCSSLKSWLKSETILLEKTKICGVEDDEEIYCSLYR